MKKIVLFFISAFTLIVAGLFTYSHFEVSPVSVENGASNLKVLAYSNFLKSWGPGRELAATFEKKHNVKIEWVEVGNAGMILENLRGRSANERPDVVVGLDMLSLEPARQMLQWRDLDTSKVRFVKELPRAAIYKDFVPFDWAPMTFVFRRGEISTPLRVDDLLKAEYANSLALQDPRESSTGLYFLIWILSIKGEDAGFEYLKALKPSIRIISPSWSSSYSLFQNKQVPMVFSFFTSTIYHFVNENNSLYQPVYFDDPHIYSVEYMGVPADCTNCELAKEFVKYLLAPESQKIIMEKNYMLPTVNGVKNGTLYDFPKNIRLIDPKSYQDLLDRREDILKKWSALSL